jgi:hypothetical protein
MFELGLSFAMKERFLITQPAAMDEPSVILIAPEQVGIVVE